MIEKRGGAAWEYDQSHHHTAHQGKADEGMAKGKALDRRGDKNMSPLP